MTVVLLFASFGLVLGGALLFTNAVEWAGHQLGLGTGAVGSILAAVATALPESTIPIVAILKGTDETEQVAIGAIVGAPFMLATIAMMLVGIAAHGFSGRRPQDERIRAHEATLRRDLLFFLAIFGVALALGIAGVRVLNYSVAPILVLVYFAYVAWTLRRGGEKQERTELSPLYFDLTRHDPPAKWQVAPQLAVAIAAIILGAHLFVEQLTAIAEAIGIAPLVLALVIAPLATELPEKVNSFIWMREGKDALALGNITGAMVFQSSLPVAVGLAFTSWKFGTETILASAFALAGGAVAMWAGLRAERFDRRSIAAWAGMFTAFVAYVAVSAG